MTRTVLLLMFCVALCAGQYVDIDEIASNFGRGLTQFSAPKLERKVSYGNFFRNISQAVQTLINEVVVELFRQVRFQSFLLTNSISSLDDELQHQLLDMNSTDINPYIETLLTKVNQRLDAYFNMYPGLQNLQSKPFVEIPNDETVHSYLTYHSLESMSSELTSIIDTHMSNINIVMNNAYKHGWRAARGSIQPLQDSFRSEYINGYILQAYNTAVKNILDRAEKIRRHVDIETWEKFVSRSTRILAIFAAINPHFSEAGTVP